MISPIHRNILNGLTDQEVIDSRKAHGINLLTPPQRPSAWKLYLEKFRDPVIRILLVAALLSFIVSLIEGEYAETIGIFFAIFLATGIGFYFEYDANKKFDLLNEVNEETPVTVVRNGKVQEIPKKDLVVGDIVMLNVGEDIPADGILLEAISLQVNESNLTGELIAIKTTDEASFQQEATYPSNRVYRGTTVVDGHGVMEVRKVGDATEIGNVAQQASEKDKEETPLHLQLSKLAHFIGKVGLSIAIITFLVFTVRDLYLYISEQGINGWEEGVHIARIVLKYFMMAVTLIVVAVPEGLPMSVTLSLALNMRRMLKTNNLVRKMHACETMGAITVICTDKTGTLTQNKMQVYEATLDERNMDLIDEGLCVNSTAFLDEQNNGVGNPTEAALLLWMKRRGGDYLALRKNATILDQQTFSTERKYMATLVYSAVAQREILYVKGAPEIILSKARIGIDEKRSYEQQLADCQRKAMRTLAVAYKYVSEEDGKKCEKLFEEGELTFLGFFAINDPVRPDVPAAVQKCRSAGIDVKIVTGDTPGTATEIARQIGLWTSKDTERNRITGIEFGILSDEEALERVLDIKVMSRARPMDKQRLVQLLQKKGAVVAVTGDGTNDAPALNHAQVGLSMGSGTSVAKEASDITLLDDSFNSIATAVMWGRSLYKNIQRFIVFQLTINLVALVSVLLGAFIGTALPLTVTQMLWVNLIMDTFAAMALSSIPPSPEVMNEKPRKTGDFIITKAMRNNIVSVGSGFLAVLLGMMSVIRLLPPEKTVWALTVFFTVFVMLQFWNLFNVSVFGTNHAAFKEVHHALGMLGVAAIILIGQWGIVQFGGEIFRTVPLSAVEWISIISVTSLILWIGEIDRLLKRRRLKRKIAANGYADKKRSI